jgi:phytoene dehydrogenase-like protein
MPVKTPVENLYCVGDGCMPSGTVGIEACAITAKIAVDEILGQLLK